VKGGKFFAFAHNALEIGGNYFGRDIAFYNLTDVFVMLQDSGFAGDAFFCH